MTTQANKSLPMILTLALVGCGDQVVGWPIPEPDLTAPTVVDTQPFDLEAGVQVNTAVMVTFSEEMDPTTLTQATFTLGNGAVLTTGEVSPYRTTATFYPSEVLAPGTEYEARIGDTAADLAGNTLAADYTWTFTTAGDDQLPTVLSTDPDDGEIDVALDTVALATFSEDMDGATLNATSVTLWQGTNQINGAVRPLGAVVTFVPNVELTADTTYEARIAASAADLDGNTLAAAYEWTFTTGSDLLAAPRVIFTDPISDAVDVPLDTIVLAGFSEDMDPLSIDETSVLLFEGTTAIPGTVAYDDVTRTTTFTPDTELLPDTTYTATITTDATDLGGTGLDEDYVWTFSTGEAASLWVPVDLGSLTTFVAVAGAGLANSNSSGITTLGGDVGLYPTATCVGDGSPCSLLNPVITGTLYAADPAGIAAKAKVDLTAAYVDAMGRPPGTIVNDLSGMTLAPGVYTSGSTMSVAVGGTVVLDAGGDKNAVWIFQIGSSLTVNNNAQVLLVNGAQPKNVFWAAFASSTLGSNVQFQGSVLAGASNSVGTDSVVVGRLLCTTGQITLLSNLITLPPL